MTCKGARCYKNSIKKLNIIFTAFLLFGCSTKENRSVSSEENSKYRIQFRSCHNDPEKQFMRSHELQEIVKADQADRQIPGSKIDWNKVSAADETRSKRVAEIFAEGCFKSAGDYAAAALVFQHGVVYRIITSRPIYVPKRLLS